MNKRNSTNSRGRQGGYTLLFAVLTAGIVMTMAVFIVNVSSKQYELSVSARNSSYAFYAADSAMECAVNPVNWSVPFASTTGGALNCGGGLLVFSAVAPVQTSGMSITDGPGASNPVRQQAGYVPLYFNNGTNSTSQCALITITTGADSASGEPKTIVDARGYNLCSGSIVGPDRTNINTVERGLRLTQTGIW